MWFLQHSWPFKRGNGYYRGEQGRYLSCYPLPPRHQSPEDKANEENKQSLSSWMPTSQGTHGTYAWGESVSAVNHHVEKWGTVVGEGLLSADKWTLLALWLCNDTVRHKKIMNRCKSFSPKGADEEDGTCGGNVGFASVERLCNQEKKWKKLIWHKQHHLPKKVSFLKLFSSTNVNRGYPAPSLLSLMAMLSPALPCSEKKVPQFVWSVCCDDLICVCSHWFVTVSVWKCYYCQTGEETTLHPPKGFSHSLHHLLFIFL